MKTNIRQHLLRKEEIENDGNIYSYELTVREGNSTADWKLPLYSIRVKMTDASGRKRAADATDVFSCKKRAMEFFDKIVRNLATPIDLAYIVEDEIT